MKLIVCTQQRYAPNPHSCGHGGSKEIADRLEREIGMAGLDVVVERSACLGMCQKGPNVRLLPDGKNWHAVGTREVSDVMDFLRAREYLNTKS